MRNSSLPVSAMASILVFCLAATGQSAPTASVQELHFTISTTQAWTDTGLDMHAGDRLAITASPSGSGGSGVCDPKGAGSASSSSEMPIPSAPAGALIGKLQRLGDAFLIGEKKQMKLEQGAHLFLGVNGQPTPACTGELSVQVSLTQAGTESPSTSATATAAPAPPSAKTVAPQPAKTAAPATKESAAAPTIQQKLAAAAQTWLAGQFGGTAPTPAQSSSPASPGITSNSAVPSTSASTATVPALTIFPQPVDPALAKNLDGLPRRVNDEFNNLGDMVNFVLIGSKEQVQNALAAANWHVADTQNSNAVANAILQTMNKQDYVAMPMSQLMLFGRDQDFGYEQAEAYSVVASRHHFRLWKAPFTYQGKEVWVGAGTHDIGFEKDQRNGKVTHKIDPTVDGERDNIARSLQQAGKTLSIAYYLPPNPVQEAKNATGGSYHSDGRLAVITLK
jgi:LssY C-terminus